MAGFKSIISVVLGIVLGLALFPVVQQSMETALANSSGSATIILGLFSLIYVIILIYGSFKYVA